MQIKVWTAQKKPFYVEIGDEDLSAKEILKQAKKEGGLNCEIEGCDGVIQYDQIIAIAALDQDDEPPTMMVR